ncbi:unnamed protein product (macronuclear) [Paramecium tetraurelia]|uniref:Transmembrane protein n=1 Tax=Paramecium tetraurelia TaxID=5888 RepID=A0D9Q0_PARTE|nr:uncharacterized protein GSPATT00014698001 [Paramecium tetraurelia]CAK79767.1 unnamed protein product [Paramecium tetraurelia]|eukprot:XP_001447164.1 hypothetical protein (macronuclear) [Paramecium tetraurelia strain d4-2]
MIQVFQTLDWILTKLLVSICDQISSSLYKLEYYNASFLFMDLTKESIQRTSLSFYKLIISCMISVVLIVELLAILNSQFLCIGKNYFLQLKIGKYNYLHVLILAIFSNNNLEFLYIFSQVSIKIYEAQNNSIMFGILFKFFSAPPLRSCIVFFTSNTFDHYSTLNLSKLPKFKGEIQFIILFINISEYKLQQALQDSLEQSLIQIHVLLIIYTQYKFNFQLTFNILQTQQLMQGEYPERAQPLANEEVEPQISRTCIISSCLKIIKKKGANETTQNIKQRYCRVGYNWLADTTPLRNRSSFAIIMRGTRMSLMFLLRARSTQAECVVQVEMLWHALLQRIKTQESIKILHTLRICAKDSKQIKKHDQYKICTLNNDINTIQLVIHRDI